MGGLVGVLVSSLIVLWGWVPASCWCWCLRSCGSPAATRHSSPYGLKSVHHEPLEVSLVLHRDVQNVQEVRKRSACASRALVW